MEFNKLLAHEGIRPEDVLVLRHRPSEPRFAKVLPWLAAERPDLYNAYQQTQGARVEAAFSRSKFVASFIGTAPGRALFVGLYAVDLVVLSRVHRLLQGVEKKVVDRLATTEEVVVAQGAQEHCAGCRLSQHIFLGDD